jgi:hypothetical protein
LPVLWFLQVSRLSDITTKEKTNRVHYLTYTAYKPLVRLLPAQILAGVLLLSTLALPLWLRYLILQQPLPALAIGTGSVFIVLLSAGLGIATGGKKLFEIMFFLITYANLNRIPFADYFGYKSSTLGLLIVSSICIFLLIVCVLIRNYEIKNT